MTTPSPLTALARITCLLIPGLLLAGASPTPTLAGVPADAMLARYRSLHEQLSHNTFQRPLHLDSTETKENLKGDIYAVLDHPFATVSPALQEIEHWCDILILHLNVKSCRAVRTAVGRTLVVNLGRKNDESPDQAYPVSFDYQVTATDDSFLRVLLLADSGPMGSRNYQIILEAVPLPAGQTFMHLSYSYDYGLAGRLALMAYLATLGSGKVGFSVTDRRPDGEAVLVNGVRGVAERNTMRYYLAVEAYLGSLSAPPADQTEKRLHDWFAATELFSRQLHELDENEYLDLKRREFLQRPSKVEPDPVGPGS